MLKVFIATVLILEVNSQKFDTTEVIQRYGFTSETYQVQTKDDYQLTIHRIVPKSPEKLKKLPCFVMHGVIASSIEFFQLKTDSLPFLLSKNGHDVYLGNSRGNQYSSHRKFHKNSTEFWDFSFHEIGTEDLPAMIDFVLNLTKSEKLIYIGMSQGSTVGVVLLSMLPEYNQKIEQLHLLAPAVFMGHFPNPILRTFGHQIIEFFGQNHNMVNFTPVANALRPLMVTFCQKGNPFRELICASLQYNLAGGNIYGIEADIDALSIFLDIFTPYASKKQLKHFLQLVESNRFQLYDYGMDNHLVYGQDRPPRYDLSNVKANTYIYCGGQDGLAHIKDVEHLRDELPNVKNFQKIFNFNHFDFEGGRHAKELVYSKIIKFINSKDSETSEDEYSAENLIKYSLCKSDGY